MMDTYYTPWMLFKQQEVSDGFEGKTVKYVAGPEIMGLYAQDSSVQARLADAQTVTATGTFTTGVDVDIREGDILRQGELYLAVTGLPVDSPEMAVSQFKLMAVKKTEAPE